MQQLCQYGMHGFMRLYVLKTPSFPHQNNAMHQNGLWSGTERRLSTAQRRMPPAVPSGVRQLPADGAVFG